MTLELVFDNSGGDYHLIITDGCTVGLDPEDQRLGKIQEGTSRREGLRRYLLYSNLIIVEEFHLKPHGEFNIFCPTCKTEYRVTREQYERVFEEAEKINVKLSKELYGI